MSQKNAKIFQTNAESVHICRLCASLKKASSFIIIADANHDVCLKLEKCCQIKIILSDVLPKFVCQECVQLLNQSYTFYTKVHESQDSLAAFFTSGDILSGNPLTAADNEADRHEKNVSGDVVSLNKLKTEHENTEQGQQELFELYESVEIDENDEDNSIESDVLNAITSEVRIPAGTFMHGSNIGSTKEFQRNKAVSSKEDDNEKVLRIENVKPQETSDEFLSDSIEIKLQLVEIDIDEDMDDECINKNDTYNEKNATITDVSETWANYSWKCVVCSINESTASELIIHSQIAHDIPSSDVLYFCNDCQKVFPRYYSLINHVRHHHRKNLSLCCDACNKFCSDFTQLATHRLLLHDVDCEYPKVLLCKICGKGFWTANSLQIHTKIHLPDKVKFKAKCDQCGRKFRNDNSLSVHMKVHSNIRPFVCDQCGKKFRQQINLEDHRLTHTSETPYECKICNYSFKTPQRLMKHSTLHTGVKPFKCSDCDKDFRTKEALQSHSRTHTGVMPYTCEYCDRPFRFRSTFKTHLNTHTGERPYSCNECSHHFTNWPNYNKHMKRRHGRTAPIKSKSSRSRVIGDHSENPNKKAVTTIIIDNSNSNGVLDGLNDEKVDLQSILNNESEIQEANQSGQYEELEGTVQQIESDDEFQYDPDNERNVDQK